MISRRDYDIKRDVSSSKGENLTTAFSDKIINVPMTVLVASLQKHTDKNWGNIGERIIGF